MIKEARGFGETITEAQEDALKNLGTSDDAEVQYEIISQSKKKVLGIFGGSKAEVRAFIELPDAPERKVKAPKKDKPKTSNKPVANKPKEEKKVEAPVKPQETVAEEKKTGNTRFSDVKLIDESQIPADSKTAKAIAYLRTVLAALDCKDVKISAAEVENGAFISLDGDDLGIIIGRRGETLDALQYLTGLAANNCSGYFKVSLNIGDYRERREEALVELAGKVAKQVLETGRSRALEPMNPYERRIIHTAIQEFDGVVSNSIGEGKNRRVVVYSEKGDSKPPRLNDRHSRGGRGNRRNDRPSNTVATTPSREPKKDSDIPLYGKIN